MKYYDNKAKASPLKEKDFCFILQPKADHQGSKIPFRDFRWIGPYLVEKVLPNNNYIVRKLNANKTQILHRIRLRKNNPEKPPEDKHQETQWQVDDNIVVPQDDLYTVAWEAEFGGHLFDIPICRMPVYSLSLNSCHHVVVISSARGERARFRVRVTLGVILTRSLVNTKHIPGCLWSGPGVVDS